MTSLSESGGGDGCCAPLPQAGPLGTVDLEAEAGEAAVESCLLSITPSGVEYEGAGHMTGKRQTLQLHEIKDIATSHDWVVYVT